MWKEAVVAFHRVLSRNLPGGTKENHENPQSAHPVSGPRFEPGTSLIRCRSANHSAATCSPDSVLSSITFWGKNVTNNSNQYH
jgi:hypothetical protein